jgi:hypothetical protein
MGTVQLTITEWQELIQLRQQAEAKVLELQARLDGESTSDTEGAIKHLLKALSSAREIVRFAVANYPPEAVRGWPHAELTNFADLLETAPGASQDYKEMAIDLKSFARAAKTIEDKRALRRIDPNIKSDYGEKIDEEIASAADGS